MPIKDPKMLPERKIRRTVVCVSKSLHETLENRLHEYITS